MIISSIAIIGIVMSLVGISFVIIRKLSEISSIDVSTIPQEKEIEIKNKILTERLSRKTHEQFNSVVSVVKPVWTFVQKNFRSLYQYFVDLERTYRRKYRPLLSKDDIAQNIEDLLQKANDFKEKENYVSAEKQYIEIITLDSKNYEAYKGLADLYMEKKEYAKAQEVFDYLVKLNIFQQKKMKQRSGPQIEEALRILERDLADVYVDSGIVWQSLGNNDSAYDCFEMALKIEELNPRYLDLLLGMSIVLGKKVKAIDIFNTLKKVNPDNKKLEEFGEKIKEMNI